MSVVTSASAIHLLPRTAVGVRFARALLLACCVAVSGCTSLFLYPDRVRYYPDRDLETPVEDVWITAADESRLHALHLPAKGAPRGVVLFLHGNAENLSSHVHAVRWLPAQGYGVLALDYRGYGRSEGRARIGSVHEDAQSALDWLAQHVADPPVPLIVYGQSLGAAVAAVVPGLGPVRGDRRRRPDPSHPVAADPRAAGHDRRRRPFPGALRGGARSEGALADPGGAAHRCDAAGGHENPPARIPRRGDRRAGADVGAARPDAHPLKTRQGLAFESHPVRTGDPLAP
jgi:pimeloyl-ACP methyl ester carboxylesterase